MQSCPVPSACPRRRPCGSAVLPRTLHATRCTDSKREKAPGQLAQQGVPGKESKVQMEDITQKTESVDNPPNTGTPQAAALEEQSIEPVPIQDLEDGNDFEYGDLELDFDSTSEQKEQKESPYYSMGLTDAQPKAPGEEKECQKPTLASIQQNSQLRYH